MSRTSCKNEGEWDRETYRLEESSVKEKWGGGQGERRVKQSTKTRQKRWSRTGEMIKWLVNASIYLSVKLKWIRTPQILSTFILLILWLMSVNRLVIGLSFLLFLLWIGSYNRFGLIAHSTFWQVSWFRLPRKVMRTPYGYRNPVAAHRQDLAWYPNGLMLACAAQYIGWTMKCVNSRGNRSIAGDRVCMMWTTSKI